MAEIIVGVDNPLSYTFTVTTGVATLVISGLVGSDLGLTSIDRIYNTTRSAFFYLDPTTVFSNTFASGLPTFSWTFTQYPAASTTGDTLLIYLNMSQPLADNLLLQNLQA